MKRAVRATRLVRGAQVLAAILLLWALSSGEARAEEGCASLATEPRPFPGPASLAQLPPAEQRPELASRVMLEHEGHRYRYTVNSEPQVVRRMGYNPMYERLSAGERRSRLERDFASMAEAGVNTVFGWDPAQFDGLTLDVAAAHGLGVALPYDFDWQLDFSSKAVQARVRGEVLDWIERFRWHPALRM